MLSGVFIVDATVTLFRRLVRGERVYAAHRSHAIHGNKPPQQCGGLLQEQADLSVGVLRGGHVAEDAQARSRGQQTKQSRHGATDIA